MLALVAWMPRTEAASPIETATETVSAKHSTIVATITGGHCAVSSSLRCGSSRLAMMPTTQNRPPTGSAR